MRRFIAIFAIVVLLDLVPGWASAGSKVELTDGQMDEVSAAGPTSFLDVYLLTNPEVHSITVNSSGSNFSVTVNGAAAPVVPTSPPAGTTTQPLQLLTQTKVLGSQSGLNLGLIQKSSSSLVQITPYNNQTPTVYKPPFR